MNPLHQAAHKRSQGWRVDLRDGNDNFVFASWKEHLKGSLNRSYGDPIQKGMAPVSERELLHWIISSQLALKPSYISARPFLGDFNDKASISLATIYLDFDSELDPGLAIADAARAYDWMEGSGIIPRIYFSGKKGCGLYIDCQEPSIPYDESLKKAVLTSMVQSIQNKGFGTLDVSASGDLKRISKLPNTLHPGSGLYCIPLKREDLSRGLDHIRSLAKKPRDQPIEIHDDNDFHETLGKLAMQILETRKETRKADEAYNALRRKKQVKRRDSGNDSFCSGLSSALEGVGEGSRQLAAIGLKRFFMSKGEDASKLKEWNLLNQPPLEEEVLEKIMKRTPDQSWCFYLHSAGLCNENCPRLKE